MNNLIFIAIVCLFAMLFVHNSNGASVSKPGNEEGTTTSMKVKTVAKYGFDVLKICKVFCKWNSKTQKYRGNCDKTKFTRACNICRDDIGCDKINSGGLFG
ncbi:uncharacterized protein LOC120337730 [Styela clava]